MVADPGHPYTSAMTRPRLLLIAILVSVAILGGLLQGTPLPEVERILLIGSLSNRTQTTENPYGLNDHWRAAEAEWVANLVPPDFEGLVLWGIPAGRLAGDVYSFSHNPCTLGAERFAILQAISASRPEIRFGLYIGSEPQEPCSLARRPWRSTAESPSSADALAWTEANLRPWLGSISTVCWDAAAQSHRLPWLAGTATWLKATYGWSAGLEAIPLTANGLPNWPGIPPGDAYAVCTMNFARTRIINQGVLRPGWSVPDPLLGRVHVLVATSDHISAAEWNSLEAAGYVIGYRNVIIPRPGTPESS